MNRITSALIFLLTLAFAGSTALAQNGTDNPPTIPADSKPHTKSTKADAKSKTTSKVAKKDQASTEEAKPLTPGPAVVKSKNVNVRDEGAIKGVVISHLNKGDHVTVIGEETIAHPKTDEPGKWAKIALPEGVASAWVYAPFVDSATHTVSKPKLNVRSGPGENFGKINTITKGAVVKEIERKGDWIKIEPPPGSYAYVAAHLIANEAAPTAVASVPKPAPAPAVVVTPPPVTTPPVTTPPTPPPPATEVAVVKPVVIGGDPTTSPAPTPIAPPPPTPVITPAAATVHPVPPPPENNLIIKVSPEPATPAGATKGEDDEDVKRVVTREGVIRRSVSIQAPTYFALEDPRSRKTINYIHSTNLVLKDFWGKHVMVTGEEELDERWPNKPVITVETLKPVD